MHPTQMSKAKLRNARPITIQPSDQATVMCPSTAAALAATRKMPPTSCAKRCGAGSSIRTRGPTRRRGFRTPTYSARGRLVAGERALPSNIAASSGSAIAASGTLKAITQAVTRPAMRITWPTFSALRSKGTFAMGSKAYPNGRDSRAWHLEPATRYPDPSSQPSTTRGLNVPRHNSADCVRASDDASAAGRGLAATAGAVGG